MHHKFCQASRQVHRRFCGVVFHGFPKLKTDIGQAISRFSTRNYHTKIRKELPSLLIAVWYQHMEFKLWWLNLAKKQEKLWRLIMQRSETSAPVSQVDRPMENNGTSWELPKLKTWLDIFVHHRSHWRTGLVEALIKRSEILVNIAHGAITPFGIVLCEGETGDTFHDWHYYWKRSWSTTMVMPIEHSGDELT